MKKYRKNNDEGLKSWKKYAIFRTNEHRNSSQKGGAGCSGPFFEVKMSRIGSGTAEMQEIPPVGGDFHFPILSVYLNLEKHLNHGACPHSFPWSAPCFFREKNENSRKKRNRLNFDSGEEHPFTTRRDARPKSGHHPASGRSLSSADAGNARHATTTA